MRSASARPRAARRAPARPGRVSRRPRAIPRRADPGRPARLRRHLPALLVGALSAALLLAALRIDLIRLRYGLAEAMRDERALLEEQRTLTARVQELRDPTRLARAARELDMMRPERVLELGAAPGAAGRP